MDVDQIDTSLYTHIHFAFADVTNDFNIDVSKVKEQFELFKAMSGVKRIISCGGWDFSTLTGTFHILREAVKPANRDVFQKNLVAFVNEHNLDGVDLDWEYPGVCEFPSYFVARVGRTLPRLSLLTRENQRPPIFLTSLPAILKMG